jgi:spore maturation protein CgeB
MEKQFRHSELKIIFLGLTITSSWGNGHAITYRGLMSELMRRGHSVLFLERDVSWYAAHRDLGKSRYGRVELYSSLKELRDRFAAEIRSADCVIIGSFVPEGIAIGEWVTSIRKGVTAFYDIDTPVTLSRLERGECEYLSRDLIRRYDLYLSFTGGPTLMRLKDVYGARRARVLYCAINPDQYFPESLMALWDLGYLGTYSEDRQKLLDDFLLEPARQWQDGRFIVAGPQYPAEIAWPQNVQRVEHLIPSEHRAFYNSQKFTLNITRADMTKAGYSPSIRLFEAAACATPIITDYWSGLETIFHIGKEILVAENADDALRFVRDIPTDDRLRIGWAARHRVLREHTAAHRAEALERYIVEARHKRVLDQQIAS